MNSLPEGGRAEIAKARNYIAIEVRRTEQSLLEIWACLVPVAIAGWLSQKVMALFQETSAIMPAWCAVNGGLGKDSGLEMLSMMPPRRLQAQSFPEDTISHLDCRRSFHNLTGHESLIMNHFDNCLNNAKALLMIAPGDYCFTSRLSDVSLRLAPANSLWLIL